MDHRRGVADGRRVVDSLEGNPFKEIIGTKVERCRECLFRQLRHYLETWIDIRHGDQRHVCGD